MRRAWFRFLCRMGLHDWTYSTLTDIDPERTEVQWCPRCHLHRGREWKKTPVMMAVEFGPGWWGPWETFEPCPEPPLGALD